VALRKGEILNQRYRIVKQLGEGGFGAIYRAEDTALKTIVAVKENLEYWDVAQRQFEQEAVLLANLRHPNLPRVTDFFMVPAQGQYLVMDFIEGYDLQTVLDRVGKPLHTRRVLEWIDQICDALAFLHTQDPPVIHRDVKPANIRITASGQAILVDFGIAKAYNPKSKTTTGARAVTAGYSPVEQYGEGPTDVRADQYALGATLYALLTAERPPESVARATGRSLTLPSELNPQLSPAVERVILRAMQVQPEDRYPGIVDFREALRQAAAPRERTTGAEEIGTSTTASAQPDSGAEQRSPDLLTPATPAIESFRSGRRATLRLPQQQAPASKRTGAQPEWVTIPTGEFVFGEERRRIRLPEFQISKFPVTNQQYQSFLAANPRHPAPLNWQGRTAPMSRLRHPVVGVSLHDALAFCRWLGCRLPMVEEWEKAARGEDGRTFPWGEDWQEGKYCNNWETQIGGTSPVDRFAEGVSPYGVWDMAGNVWEWTDSEFKGPYMHILRGGSWRSFGNFAVRVTHSDGLVIDDRRDDLGFRCARSV
jgi:formylglycine-generating enzyme required for sulfatase activity